MKKGDEQLEFIVFPNRINCYCSSGIWSSLLALQMGRKAALIKQAHC
jgi:hypothetical protein